MLTPPVAVNRTLAIERLDYNTPDGKERLMGARGDQSSGRARFHLEPLQGFHLGAATRTRSPPVAATSTRSSANLTNEARLSYSTDDLGWTVRIRKSQP